MTIEMKALLAVMAVVGVTALLALIIRIPKRLKPNKFERKWKDLQQFCRDKKTWPQAIVHADKLLDEALRKRKFKGKSMGERMVSAGARFGNNDLMWFAHNLTKKVLLDPDARLKEDDVKQALLGYKLALKDLGAFSRKDEPGNGNS